MSTASAKKLRPKYLTLPAILFEIRLPLPGWISILHRISGALLVFPLVAWLLYLLDASLASEASFEKIGQREKAVEGLAARRELDEEVHVAVRTRLVAEDGSKQGQPRNAECAHLCLGLDKARDRPLSRQRFQFHRHQSTGLSFQSQPRPRGITPAHHQRRAVRSSSAGPSGACAVRRPLRFVRLHRMKPHSVFGAKPCATTMDRPVP